VGSVVTRVSGPGEERLQDWASPGERGCSYWKMRLEYWRHYGSGEGRLQNWASPGERRCSYWKTRLEYWRYYGPGPGKVVALVDAFAVEKLEQYSPIVVLGRGWGPGMALQAWLC